MAAWLISSALRLHLIFIQYLFYVFGAPSGHCMYEQLNGETLESSQRNRNLQSWSNNLMLREDFEGQGY